MGISDLIIFSYNRTYFEYFYEASKDPPVGRSTEKSVNAIKRETDRCWMTYTDSKTVTSYYLCSEHMRKHLTPFSTIKQEGSTESCQEVTMNSSDALTGFVDQLNALASSFSTLASASSAFPSLANSNASSANEALKWTDLVQDTVYQIVSTRTVNTQHGQSIIRSLQKADGSCCSGWACAMLTKELLQNPMAMMTSRLFVQPTGSKTSKIGRVYNSLSTVAVLINCM